MRRVVWIAIVLAGCGSIDGVDFLFEDIDTDGDTIIDALDPLPDDRRVCGDEDGDGCDDCSIEARPNRANDGFDPDGDGACDVPVDFGCMNESNAADHAQRIEACALLSLVNADRAYFVEESGNAAPLRWSEEIWRVAQDHAEDMCERNFFDHINPDGIGPSGRAAIGGLNYQLAENIASNFDPRSTEYAYMAEPTCTGHRGNILERAHVEIGIGYTLCGSQHLSVQNFRADWSIASSEYCQTPATDCELPDDPPSTATCPEELTSICPAPSPTWLNGWDCPVD